MNNQELLSAFDRALAWNAALYSVYKITSTFLTFLLYSKLTSDDFCLWANTNSIIFMTLLWSDLGLRYAATQFMPVITTSKDYKKIITTIILCKLALITLSVPIALILLTKTIPNAQTLTTNQLVVIAVWYIAEGLVAVMQTIYHAQFQNKRFNLIQSIVLVAELMVIAYCAIIPSTHLVTDIYLIKAIGGLTITVLALMLFKNYEHKHPHTPTDPTLYQRMAEHAAVLWGTSALKSLSERNFLMPIISNISGSAYAAAFKLALDSALLLQRTVLKTIGTADSALLTHARQQGRHTSNTDKEAQDRLINRITWIIGLLVIVYGGIGMYSLGSSASQEMVMLFFVLLCGYAAELRLLPYERMLEVHQAYKDLIYIYAWYALALGVITISFITKSVTPLIYITVLQGIRFATVYWMSRKAKEKYT